MEKVIKIPGYDNAFITKVNGMYKVQVGAFSSKQNAINMGNQLKAHGFNVFITTN